MSFTSMRPKGTFLFDGFVDLCVFLKKNNVKKILEIGSCAGESLSLFKNLIPGSSVISIDPWNTVPDENDFLKDSNLNIIESEFNQKNIKFKFYW